MAQRVPVLARGVDLRRELRDPAEHHRPTAARPRERSMIEGEDLELFERSLRAATEQHSGDELDAAVAALGWDDALSYDTRAAVSTLFELQGAACARSSALDRVVAFALDHELGGDTAVVLPPVGATVVSTHEGTVHGLA